MCDPTPFVVDQLGIKDIDGYGHVWYGNYMKFFERSIQKFLGDGRVVRVEHLKYKRSVPWGAADSRIESYLVARPEPGRALVYQRWCVGHEEDAAFALCLSLVTLPPGSPGDAVAVMDGGARLLQGRAGGREPKLAMAVKNLQTGGIKDLSDSESILGRILIPRHVFADMVSSGTHTMALVDVMDLFEQSRSEVVGGQPGLKAFMDRGLGLVVGQVDELVLGEGVTLSPGMTVQCEVTLLRETTERRCFHFQQRLLRPDGAEVARVRVLMCCVDASKG
jgi:acyl-CoA thioesterase FadM